MVVAAVVVPCDKAAAGKLAGGGWEEDRFREYSHLLAGVDQSLLRG